MKVTTDHGIIIEEYRLDHGGGVIKLTSPDGKQSVAVRWSELVVALRAFDYVS
jgi:hypothetical protein